MIRLSLRVVMWLVIVAAILSALVLAASEPGEPFFDFAVELA